MEDGVYGSHAIGESEGKGVSSDLGNDFVGAQVLFGEFLGGSCRSEESCFDEDLISDLEVRSRHSLCVGRSLISALGFGDLFSEFLMEFV